MTFSVLFVCTGNVCRSPIAERVLAAWMAERCGPLAGRVEVSSAGTGALTGQSMTEEAADLVVRHGGDPSGHVARMVTEEVIGVADVILTAAREHRTAVVQLQPSAVHRTFTVREAGRVALARGSGLPGTGVEERWRSLVPVLAAGRGSVPTRSPRADDVADPYRQPPEVYARTASQLLPALTALRDAVAPRHR